jgi:glutamate formiminotransferase
MTTPMKSILDPTFHYTDSTHTDLRKTFARIRRDQRKQQAVKAPRNEPIPNLGERRPRLIVYRPK